VWCSRIRGARSEAILDKVNVMSTIHLRKLIATLVRGQIDIVIGKFEERIGVLEDLLNEMKTKPNTDVMV